MKSLWIWITLLLIGLPFTASQAEYPDSPDYEPELEHQLKVLEAWTVELRGLDALQPVQSRFVSRDAIRDEIESQSSGDINALMHFYVAFDLLDAEVTNLSGILREMNAANVGGYYELGMGQFVVVLEEGDDPGTSLTPTEQVVYVHEFTHALQDQHFNVRRLMRASRTHESYVAALALVEGDAMFTQNRFIEAAVQVDPEQNAALMDVSLLGENTPPDVTVPPIIRAELDFIYLGGMNFVKSLYDLGGWAMVNAAYDDPPRSTEHIIHPDRYLAGDMPLDVNVRGVLNVFDDSAAWSRLSEDTLGAFYLREYLHTQLDLRSVDVAVTGWGGDRFMLYHNASTDQRAWILKTAWDTVDDARTFSGYYGQFAERRTAGSVLSYDDVLCWGEKDIALCLLYDDDLRVWIANAPTVAEARAMIVAQR